MTEHEVAIEHLARAFDKLLPHAVERTRGTDAAVWDVESALAVRRWISERYNLATPQTRRNGELS